MFPPPAPPLPSLADCVLVELGGIVDERGVLIVAEVGRQVPFAIARVFAIAGMEPHTRRGQHAHRACHQLLICLQGTVEVTLFDGSERSVVVLDCPSTGLHIPPGIWAEQVYRSVGTVLMVLCNNLYDEGDYIRCHEDFLQYRLSV